MTASATVADVAPETISDDHSLPRKQSISKTKFACRFCGSESLAKGFNYPDRDGRSVEIFLCRDCHCFVPRFGEETSPASMLEFQIDVHEKQWPELTEAEARELAAGCHSIVDYCKTRFNSDETILEIGSGRGGLLKALLEQGFSARGCEPSSRLVELARKAYAFDPATLSCQPAEMFLDEIRTEKRAVQAVFLWHVLEHVSKPFTLLRQIAGILRPDGLLIAQVPLLNTEQIYSAHLFFLSEPAVNHAAQRCGFRVEEFNYDLDRKFMAFVLRKSRPANARGPFELDLSAPAGPPVNGVRTAPAQAAPKPDTLAASAPAIQSSHHNAKLPANEISKLRKKLEKAPKDPVLWDALGEACCQAKQMAEAKEAFAKAAALAPGEGLPWVKLALAQRELKHVAGAEESLNRALRINPNHETALQQLALSFMSRRQFEDAMRLFWRIEKLNPQNVEALLLGARCQFETGDLVAARLNYLRALKLEPEIAEAKQNLAVLDAMRSAPPPSETAKMLKLAKRAGPPPLNGDVLKREFPCPFPFQQLYMVPRARLDLRFCSYHRPVLFGDQDGVFREGIGALDALLNGHPQFVARRDRFLAGDFKGAGCSENCIWFNKWKTTGKGFTIGEHLAPDGKFKLGKIWLSMGPDCNVSCRYCLEASEFNIDFNTCDPKVMVLARDFVRRGGELLLTGGETFLPKWGFAKALEDLVNWGDAKGSISLHTNGTFLNGKNRDLLLRGPVASVGISMDTLRKDLYEYLRRGTKFDLVWGNATSLAREKKARNLQNPSITLLCAVMKSTAGHLTETVDRAVEAGLGISLNALFQACFSPTFSAREGLHNLSLGELEKLHQDVLRIEQKYGPGGWVNCAGFKGQVENVLACARSGQGERQVILGGGGHAPRLPHFSDIEAAERLVAQRRFAEARKKVEPWRDKSRRSTRFLHVLADIERGGNNLSAAADCYSRILELDPRDQKALDFRQAHPESVP